jgi:hypothetical protein
MPGAEKRQVVVFTEHVGTDHRSDGELAAGRRATTRADVKFGSLSNGDTGSAPIGMEKKGGTKDESRAS